MPWVHFHAWANGDVYPCCMATPAAKMGNLKDNTLAEIWNAEGFRQLRLNMLQDRPSPACENCYRLEASASAHTLRLNSLTTFQHFRTLVESTQPDGRLEAINMAYMDIRFSNLCNFKCRTCGPLFSSAWAQELGLGEHRINLSLMDLSQFWSQIEPLLEQVEEVYFAGGEPLISPEHYLILKKWIESGKTNVRLRYTTNFSLFRNKSQNLLELWAQFSDVRVAASLDASGARGEYLRKGTQWRAIEENRREMLRRAPHVYFEITPTLSAYNIWHFSDFHRDWIAQGLVQPHHLRLNYLLDPKAMRAQVLPNALKTAVEQKIQTHIVYLEGLSQLSPAELAGVRDQFQALVRFMWDVDASSDWPRFLLSNRALDEKRNEKLVEVFNEFQEYV